MSSSRYAVVSIFGRQFKVSEGTQVAASFQKHNKVGDKVTFSEVFMIHDGQNLNIGQPTIPGARVTAEVVSFYREKKILVFKFLRKNKLKKTRGHRQPMTALRVVSIEHA